MKSLFVRNLYLWPRFSPSVMACMEARKVDVVELYVSLTSAMVACQTSLLELLDGCVKEIKRCNSAVSTIVHFFTSITFHSFSLEIVN